MYNPFIQNKKYGPLLIFDKGKKNLYSFSLPFILAINSQQALLLLSVVLLFIILVVITLMFYFSRKRIQKKRVRIQKELNAKTSEYNIAQQHIKDLETRQAQYEEQIRELHQKMELNKQLALIPGQSENAILLMGPQGEFIWVNNSYTDLFGFTLNELKQKVSSNIIGPKTAPEIKALIETCKNQRKPVDYEFSTISKTGRTIWVKATLSPIMDESGEIIHLVAIDSDITALKEKELKAEEDNIEISEQRNHANEEIERIEHINEKYRNLGNLGDELVQEENEQNSLTAASEYIIQLLDCDYFGVAIYNARNDYLQFKLKGKNDILDIEFNESLNSKESLAVYAFKKGETVHIENLETEIGKYLPDIRFRFIESPGSLIYIPLNFQKHKYGLLCLYSNSYNNFNENDLIIAQISGAFISCLHGYFESQSKKISLESKVESNTSFAKVYQELLLPGRKEMEKMFSTFTIYRPKETVSGDFYWYYRLPSKGMLGRALFGVFDCNGLGVSGAVFAFLINRFLFEYIALNEENTPAEFLRHLDKRIKESLSGSTKYYDEYVRGSLCYFEQLEDGTTKLIFSGARNRLFHYGHASQKVSILTGARRNIGGIRSKSKRDFEDKQLVLSRGDILYFSTDGIIKQTNFKGTKFGTNQLLFTLERYAEMHFKAQKAQIEAEIDLFMKNEIQRDDMMLIGLKP